VSLLATVFSVKMTMCNIAVFTVNATLMEDQWQCRA